MSNETSKHGYFESDLQEEIKELSNNIPKHFVELGRKLNRVQSSDDYDLGRVRKNVNQDKSTVYDLIMIYKTFFKYLDRGKQSLPPDCKREIGWSKWLKISTYLHGCSKRVLKNGGRPNFVNLSILVQKGKNFSRRKLKGKLQKLEDERVILPRERIESVLYRDFEDIRKVTPDRIHWHLRCPNCGHEDDFWTRYSTPEGVYPFHCGCGYSCSVLNRAGLGNRMASDLGIGNLEIFV